MAKAAPDGQTLLLISGNFSTFPSLYRHLPYDPVKDLQPISNLGATPLVVVVNPAVPAKSVKELIDYVRSRTGQVNYAAPGVGSMGHLAAELFKRTAQIEMEHIAYKGGGPAITALLGGEVQLYFSTVPAAIVQAKAGRLRAIATTGQKRSRAFPELPTLAESGLPGYDVTVWFGMLAPTGTAQSIVDLLYRKVVGDYAHRVRCESIAGRRRRTHRQQPVSISRADRTREPKVGRSDPQRECEGELAFASTASLCITRLLPNRGLNENHRHALAPTAEVVGHYCTVYGGHRLLSNAARLSASEVRQNPGHAGSIGRDGRGEHYLGRDHGTAVGAAARGGAQ